jgi:hypothetical protein
MKVGALTVDIKIGENPLEFATKLIELLCESGVAREIVEDVEHLIAESLVSEVNNTDRRKLFNLVKNKEVEKQLVGQNSEAHYEFVIDIGKDKMACIQMTESAYNKLMEKGE